MVPQWRITDILLKEEERDWATSLRVQTQFDAETAKALYDGLETLATSLKLTLKSDIDLPDVRAELGTVENLITYYEKQGHLNDRGAELGSLSYLKAAAVCWILKLEDAKAATSSPRARAAYDEKIFGVVQRFWVAEPMNRVEPPPALRDYIAQRNRASRATEPAHQPRFDIGPALEKLDPRLKARWEGGWAALRSENPDRVSQAANSMVEVLDQVIDRIRGAREFRDYLSDRFAEQADVVLATRTWLSKVKESLQTVKHHSKEQPAPLAEDLMHQAESIIKLLLR